MKISRKKTGQERSNIEKKYQNDIKEYKRLIKSRKKWLEDYTSYDEKFDSLIDNHGKDLNKIPKVFYTLRFWENHYEYLMQEYTSSKKAFVVEYEPGYVISEKIIFDLDLMNKSITFKVYDFVGEKIKRNQEDNSFNSICDLYTGIEKFFNDVSGIDKLNLKKSFKEVKRSFKNKHRDYDGELIIYVAEDKLGNYEILSRKQQKKKFKFLQEGEKLGLI